MPVFTQTPGQSDIGSALTSLPGGSPFPEIEFGELVSTFIQIGLIMAVVVAFIFLLIGGIKWITSAGDKEKLASAQKTIIGAIIGLTIIFSLWAIIGFLETLFDISILKEGMKIPGIGVKEEERRE